MNDVGLMAIISDLIKVIDEKHGRFSAWVFSLALCAILVAIFFVAIFLLLK